MKRKTLYFDEAPSKNTGYIELHNSLDELFGEDIEAHNFLPNMEIIERDDDKVISNYQYFSTGKCISIVSKREGLCDANGNPRLESFQKVHALEYACLCEYWWFMWNIINNRGCEISTPAVKESEVVKKCA